MNADNQFPAGWFVRAYLWATTLLYGPLAWVYDAVAWLVSFGYWSRWRLDALEYLQPGIVLETGFGTGALLLSLSEGGFDVIGLELSPQMHKVTARRLRNMGLAVKRVRGRSEAMPFMTHCFDNVVSTFPSNYILDERTLREVFRIIRCNGRWVVVGLGVEFNSGIKRLVTDLWMGHAADLIIPVLMQKMAAIGFQARRVDHQSDGYTLPVLIMEKKGDD